VRVRCRGKLPVTEEEGTDAVRPGEPCVAEAWGGLSVPYCGDVVIDEESFDACEVHGAEHAARTNQVEHTTAPAQLMEDRTTRSPSRILQHCPAVTVVA
jgi:hypothetical protein